MPRYFIEVSYKGTSFRGFQVQENAVTVQGELNKALATLFKSEIETTTSSRTDSGVHALQNFLHLDSLVAITPKMRYNLNAIISSNIVIQNVYEVPETAHSRFDAISREYLYYIRYHKDPFLLDTSYFYPYPLDIDLMNEAASLLLKTTDFSSFAKRHSDVSNHNCLLEEAIWTRDLHDQLVFKVISNRFLRGMVRALVATQILVGRKKVTLSELEDIIHAKNCTRADFSAPAHGLFLKKVNYPQRLLAKPI